RDEVARRVVEENFNCITPENDLKWKALERTAGNYDFSAADAFFAFAEQRGLRAIGHTLLWHDSSPDWIFIAPDGSTASAALLLDRLRGHVHTVVGRYRGRALGWDVVNEAFLQTGELRDHAWYRILGDTAIIEAFRAAHEADPSAELYYNDYGLWDAPKRQRVIALVRDLRARGLRVDAVGLQEHITLEGPTIDRMRAALADFAAAGIPVMITELDVSVLPRPRDFLHADVNQRLELDPGLDPYREGLPAEVQKRLARRYADVFALYTEFRGHIRRVTFWGVTDRATWLHNWPIKGRRDHPLLFDADGQPKPAFRAVVDTLRERANLLPR
ncbi:MAG TPA: endo-1,4-beta-xylanase, partial [Acidobacteriota bacterium]|nr:endo-1,4-beta-xylanase [Acidobacteriota bacterium]